MFEIVFRRRENFFVFCNKLAKIRNNQIPDNTIVYSGGNNIPNFNPKIHPTVINLKSEVPGRKDKVLAHVNLAIGYTPPTNMRNAIVAASRSVIATTNKPGVFTFALNASVDEMTSMQISGRINRSFDHPGFCFMKGKVCCYSSLRL